MESLPSELNEKTTIHDLPVEIQKTIAREIRDGTIEDLIYTKTLEDEKIKKMLRFYDNLKIANDIALRGSPRFDMTPVQARLYDERAARIKDLKKNIAIIKELQDVSGKNFVPRNLPVFAAELRGRRGGVPFPKPA